MDYHLALNWPEFIERYWQKRPVVLKRGSAILSTLSRLTNWLAWPWKTKSTAAW
ncbi:cupin 4 family protein [Enterobacter cloacae]|uniref:Cupin 4 family protein n=1 Tax=Enterobacter cloacae TaxID=550 RepID=A0A377M1W7_ENTCL|nr:cupin 4 family protein [Enterobacter cloacae]